jgi:micrococcal nuclease
MRRLGITALLLVLAFAAGRSGVAGSVLGPGGGGSGGGGPHDDRIARVVDGDTVHLTGLGRARLIGIDTPEVYGGVQCYGRAASAFAKRLLPPGTAVRWRWDAEHRDRYGRALVYLTRRRDGLFVNAELARRGYARTLTIPPNDAHAGQFRNLANAARRAGRGLWHTC